MLGPVLGVVLCDLLSLLRFRCIITFMCVCLTSLIRDVISLVRPTGVNSWISFAPVFSSLYCPYLCFISFLYLDLYAIENDTSISCGSFIRTN